MVQSKFKAFETHRRHRMSSKEVKDFSIIITSFHLKFVGFWIADNHVERLWMNFALFYTFFAILLALSVEMRDLYYTWGDFGVSEEYNLTIRQMESRNLANFCIKQFSNKERHSHYRRLFILCATL